MVKNDEGGSPVVGESGEIKQGNRGDMQKIHMTLQFFESRGPQGHFFEKGTVCVKLQASIVFVLPGSRVQTGRHTNPLTDMYEQIREPKMEK